MMSTNNCSEGVFSLSELRAHRKSIEIEAYLSKKLSRNRYCHVLSVQEMAVKLARCHKADVWKVSLAALLHDCAKWMEPDELYSAVSRYEIRLDAIEQVTPVLLHAHVGVKLALERFAVTDSEVLEAIRCHTTGHASMGVIAQLVYVADFAEPMRTHEGVKVVRDLAWRQLSVAVHWVACYKIYHLLKKRVVIHPDTLATYNSTLLS